MKNILLAVLALIGLLVYICTRELPPAGAPAPRVDRRPAPRLQPESSPPADPPAPPVPPARPPSAVTPDISVPGDRPQAARPAAPDVERTKSLLLAAQRTAQRAQLSDSLPSLQTTLEAARAGGDTTAKLKASKAYNDARLALADMESNVFAADVARDYDRTAPAATGPTSKPSDPTDAVNEARKSVDAAKARARDVLAQASKEYSTLRAELPRLKDELDQARKGDDTVARLSASKRLNDAKGRAEQLESDQYAKDEGVKSARSELTEADRRLAKASAERTAAVERIIREQKRLAAAAEAAHVPMKDLNVGTVGMMPAITIVQVIDQRRMLVRVDDNHPLVMVEGVSTMGAADGQTKSIPIPMKISGTTSYTSVLGAKKTVVVATPYVPG
jgi:hypothetical protein